MEPEKPPSMALITLSLAALLIVFGGTLGLLTPVTATVVTLEVTEVAPYASNMPVLVSAGSRSSIQAPEPAFRYRVFFYGTSETFLVAGMPPKSGDNVRAVMATNLLGHNLFIKQLQ